MPPPRPAGVCVPIQCYSGGLTLSWPPVRELVTVQKDKYCAVAHCYGSQLPASPALAPPVPRQATIVMCSTDYATSLCKWDRHPAPWRTLTATVLRRLLWHGNGCPVIPFDRRILPITESGAPAHTVQHTLLTTRPPEGVLRTYFRRPSSMNAAITVADSKPASEACTPATPAIGRNCTTTTTVDKRQRRRVTTHRPPLSQPPRKSPYG